MNKEELNNDNKFVCSDTSMVRQHIEVLATLKRSVVEIDKKQDQSLKNDEEIFQRLNAVEKSVLKIETEKKTAMGLIGIISGAIGTLLTWFFKSGGTH